MANPFLTADESSSSRFDGDCGDDDEDDNLRIMKIISVCIFWGCLSFWLLLLCLFFIGVKYHFSGILPYSVFCLKSDKILNMNFLIATCFLLWHNKPGTCDWKLLSTIP